MSAAEKRIKEHFPSIYVTLASVVVALGVERLFERVGSLASDGGTEAILIWVQAFAAFQLAVCVWFMTTLFVTSVRWVLGFGDALGPFGLLLMLNLLISSIGPERAHLWLYLASTGSLAWAAVILSSLRKAAAEAENRGLIRRDCFMPSVFATLALGVVMLAFAVPVHAGRGGHRAAIAGSVLFSLGLGIATFLWYRGWRQSVGLTEAHPA